MRILVQGHRGARARRPENTIPGFEYAIACGADVLELDVVVTRDDVVVVSHEPLIEGLAIGSLTLAELQRYDCGSTKNPSFPEQEPEPGARIPTLGEVFSLGRGNSVHFNVEAKLFVGQPELTPKPEPFAEMILGEVRAHGLESRVILQSFDARPVRAMEKLEPTIRRGALFEESRDWMEVAREFAATQLGPEHSLVTTELVSEAHAVGLQVVPWTANTTADWKRLVEAGVDAIITDDPCALIGWLAGG